MNIVGVQEMLIEFLIKSAVVVSVGLVPVLLTRKMAPSWRHSIWMWVFVVSLAIPVLLIFPRWKVVPVGDKGNQAGRNTAVVLPLVEGGMAAEKPPVLEVMLQHWGR